MVKKNRETSQNIRYPIYTTLSGSIPSPESPQIKLLPIEEHSKRPIDFFSLKSPLKGLKTDYILTKFKKFRETSIKVSHI